MAVENEFGVAIPTLLNGDTPRDVQRRESELNEIEFSQYLERQAAKFRRENELAERMAHEQIRYHPSTGKFVRPKYDILAAHQELVRHREYDLEFSPKNYPSFDKVVAEMAEIPGLADTNHPDYKRYAPLRENIAVVRNFVLDELFPDGKFDEGDVNDKRSLEMIPEIAGSIGNALLLGKPLLKRPWSVHLSPAKANVTGSGAAEIYKALLRDQEHLTIFNLKSFLPGHHNKDWDLPPVENTPFSPANMIASLPAGTPLTAKFGDEAVEIEQQFSRANVLATSAITLGLAAQRLRNVESLDQPVLDHSVELGREILRKLRIQLGQSNQGTDMQVQGAAPRPEEQAQLLAGLVTTYGDYVAAACAKDPVICKQPEVYEANLAAGKLAYVVKAASIRELAAIGDTATVETLKKDIAAMPDEWKEVKGESVESLINRIEKGYELAAATATRNTALPSSQTVAGQQEEKRQENVQAMDMIAEDERRRLEQLAKAKQAATYAVNPINGLGVMQVAYVDPKAPKRDEDKPKPRDPLTVKPKSTDKTFAATAEEAVHSSPDEIVFQR